MNFLGLEGMQRIVPGLLDNTAQGMCDQIVDELQVAAVTSKKPMTSPCWL